ncbi:hypothetical protein E2P81_ATG09207 [Venturia nashicola]|nr:hypothetical protein E2P81_ATG09207 [Venturia nashicola]
MFSIYSHVKNRNRPQSPDDFDSDAQTPTPPPTFPSSRLSQSATIFQPSQAVSLPGPTRLSSRVDLPRNSAPAFTRHSQPHPQPIAPATILFPSKDCEPSTSDEEEAGEAPAIEEFLAGDSPDQDGRWAKEAVVKREASPIQHERPDQPFQRPEQSPITPPPSSRKEQIFNQHRGFLLGIKRSLRGRILSNAPVGDRSTRNLRYVSPFTSDELQDFYNRRRRESAERIEAWSEQVSLEGAENLPEIIEREESVEVPKRLQPRTPEPKKQGGRRRSSGVSSRHTSVRNGRVEKSKGTSVAARRTPITPSSSKSAALRKLAIMLTDDTIPDTEIAPLVTTWTNTLLSKIDTLNASIAEKDGIISTLESEAEILNSNVETASQKVRGLQIKLARLEGSVEVKGEIEGLKNQIQILMSEKRGDQQKVQNLNQQLSTLVRQVKIDKKTFEKKELALMKQMEDVKDEQMNGQAMMKEGVNMKQANKEKENSFLRQSEFTPPSSIVQADGTSKLQAKYDALEKVAREVAKHCGAMAGDNFGPFGSSLATLKRHLGD